MSVAHLALLVTPSANLALWLRELLALQQENVRLLSARDWDGAGDLLGSYHFDVVVSEVLPAAGAVGLPLLHLCAADDSRTAAENSAAESCALRLPFAFAQFARKVVAAASMHWQREVDAHPCKVECDALGGRVRDKESDLLRCMLRAGLGCVVRRELELRIWGHDEESKYDTHALDTHLYRLRQCLNAAGVMEIVNNAGGYTLQPAAAKGY